MFLTLQPVAVPEEWNEKVVAALTVVKKALLKEENERCQAQAELKLELKNLNQHMQTTDDRLHNAVSQVFAFERKIHFSDTLFLRCILFKHIIVSGISICGGPFT